MIDFFMSGGLMMWFLLIIAIVIIALSVRKVIQLYGKEELSKSALESGINAIVFWGAIAAIIGFFSHYWGLYNAMQAIMRANDISPGIVAGGYAVSLITILSGLTIFICSMIIWFILRWRYKQLSIASR